MISHDIPLLMGSLMFDGMDQFDLTGPIEVLSRVPNSTYQIYAKTGAPARDLNGLRLVPDAPRGVATESTVPLRLAAELRGDEVAQAIQLSMVYAPGTALQQWGHLKAHRRQF